MDTWCVKTWTLTRPKSYSTNLWKKCLRSVVKPWSLSAHQARTYELEDCCTLRPFETLLSSGLPMMIWQKKYFSHFTVNRNERTCQMTEIQNCTLWFDKKTASIEFCQLQINLEAKSMHGSSWKKDSIISKFALFFAGQVLFTVNGLL